MFVILCLSSGLFAIERNISYQGKLTDLDGFGITGTHNLHFRVYNDPVSGTMFDSVTVLGVDVNKGLFTVQMPLDLTAGQLASPELWLEIWVSGVAMTPRLRIGHEVFAMASWFAHRSDSTLHADTAQFARTTRYSDSTGAVHWDDVVDKPLVFGGFQKVRATENPWLRDSATFAGEAGVSVRQSNDTLYFASSSAGDFIQNQDAAPQAADFWVSGHGIIGGVESTSDEDFQFGEGTLSLYNRPFNGWYRYARFSAFFSSSEIGAPTPYTIDKISNYMHYITGCLENPWVYNNVQIYFMHTTATSAPSTWDVSSATRVFGPADISFDVSIGWKEVDITDFEYNGRDNLIIFIQTEAHDPYYDSNAPRWRYTTTPGNMSSGYQSDVSWGTTLTTYTARPDYILHTTDYPTIIDRVTVSDGDIDGDGDLTMGGDIEGASFTLGGVTITTWNGIVDFDTINATRHDTVVVSEALKVMGELIADSIQAVGDTVFVDDVLKAECGVFRSANTFDVLMYQEFSGSTFPPVGWTRTTISTADSMWHRSTIVGEFSSAPAGANVHWAFTNQNEWLITPEVFIPSLATYYLTFRSFGYFGSIHGDIFNVEITDDDGVSWYPVVALTDSTPSGWTTWDRVFTVNLTPWASSAIRIGFHAENAGGLYYNWNIDDVGVWADVGGTPPGVVLCDGNISADRDIAAESFNLDGVTITEWPEPGIARFDTINATDHDTVVVSEALKVMGELIADSIQAVGDTIFMDDHVKIDGNVYLDSLFLNGVGFSSWPVASFDTINATRHDTVVVSEALKVMGELIADSIQAVGDTIFMDDHVKIDGNVYADSLYLGGVVRGDWPDLSTVTLDVAYRNGASGLHTITIDEGSIFMNAIATGSHNSGNALYLRNDDDVEASLRVYNASGPTGGPAIECSGNLRMSGTANIRTYSTADLNYQLDYGGNSSTVNTFYIRDDAFTTIWSLNENGVNTLTRGSFTAPKLVTDSITLGGVTRISWPSGGTVDFDTINATRHDTVVVSEALKVMGELIADSIQAAGDTLFIDDIINTDHGVAMPVRLYDQNYLRTDWKHRML